MNEVWTTGGKNIRTVDTARGSPPIIRKNLLLPNLEVERSDQEATNGSVIASTILPKNIIAPNTVIIPKNLSLETKRIIPSATFSLGGSRKAIEKVNQIESNNTHPVVDRLYRKNLLPLNSSISFSFLRNPTINSHHRFFRYISLQTQHFYLHDTLLFLLPHTIFLGLN